MKRDMNLVRKIAIHIESTDDPIDSSTMEIDGYLPEQIGYHCTLMKEAGLIDAIDTTCMDSRFSEMQIHRLTWLGHDFVDAAKDDGIWKKVTGQIKERVTAMAFDGLLAMLKTAGTQIANQGMEWVSQ
jgi:hypothetical protein